MVAWALRGLYRKADEKVPAEIEARLKNAKELRETELTALLADARQALGRREDLDKHKDIDIALQKMLSHLDPYTTYVDPEQLDRLKQETRSKSPATGVSTRKDATTDMLLVVTPIKGSPAYHAGLQTGDIITAITREKDSHGNALPGGKETTSTKGMALS